MALALAITENQAVPESISNFVAVCVTGFVLSTMIVNGLTLQPLISFLGLNKLSDQERALRNQALVLALKDLDTENDRSALEDGISKTARDNVSAVFKKGAAAVSDVQVDQLSQDERVRLGLSMIAQQEYELTLQAYGNELFDRLNATLMMNHAEQLLDEAKHSGVQGYQAMMNRILDYSPWLRFQLRIHHFFRVQRWLGASLANRFDMLIDLRAISRALTKRADEQVRSMIGDVAADTVEKILQDRKNAIEEKLLAMRLQFPKYAAWLEEAHLGGLARIRERAQYRSMLNDSLISTEVYQDLVKQLDLRWAFLNKRPDIDLHQSAPELISRVPLLQGLSDQARQELGQQLHTRLALPNDLIMDRHGQHHAMYFVASGAVTILLPDHTHINLGTGEHFGALRFFSPEPAAYEVRSLGFSTLLELSDADFTALLNTDPNFKQAMEKAAQSREQLLRTGHDDSKDCLVTPPDSQQANGH